MILFPRDAQVVKKWWDESAGFEIIEEEEVMNSYKVIKIAHANTQAMELIDPNRIIVCVSLVNDRQSTHILKGYYDWCTYGTWQAFHYPCHQASDYLCKWLVEKDLAHVFLMY